jgi:hypothetical protein
MQTALAIFSSLKILLKIWLNSANEGLKASGTLSAVSFLTVNRGESRL